jgi:hypothetical protein
MALRHRSRASTNGAGSYGSWNLDPGTGRAAVRASLLPRLRGAPHLGASSSAGQSARLISVRSEVQILPGPLFGSREPGAGDREQRPDPWFLAAVSWHGGVAQLGERLLCKQEGAGSKPVTSTRTREGMLFESSEERSDVTRGAASPCGGVRPGMERSVFTGFCRFRGFAAGGGGWCVMSAQEGHLVDALALRGEEGRSTLRKAAGRGERPVIRRSPNGATHPRKRVSPSESIGWRGEPGELKHLTSRRKGHQQGAPGGLVRRVPRETPSVVASERGRGQWPQILPPEAPGRAGRSG